MCCKYNCSFKVASSNVSILLKIIIASMPYAFAVTRNLSIKLVVVVGLLMVTIRKPISILEAIICVCLDKFTDLRTI